MQISTILLSTEFDQVFDAGGFGICLRLRDAVDVTSASVVTLYLLGSSNAKLRPQEGTR